MSKILDATELPKVINLEDVNQITETTRLFYEIGYYTGTPRQSSWVHTGRFKEIKNVLEFKKNLELEESQRPRFKEYLRHHNFKITV